LFFFPFDAPENQEDSVYFVLYHFLTRFLYPGTAGKQYSGKFNVRIPKSLHRKLDEMAEKEGVSLNHFLVSASFISVPYSLPVNISRYSL
jgi:hypothetical protein